MDFGGLNQPWVRAVIETVVLKKRGVVGIAPLQGVEH